MRRHSHHCSNALDIVSPIHEENFVRLFIESHDVCLRFAVKPDQGALHAKAEDNDHAIWLFPAPDQALRSAAPNTTAKHSPSTELRLQQPRSSPRSSSLKHPVQPTRTLRFRGLTKLRVTTEQSEERLALSQDPPLHELAFQGKNPPDHHSSLTCFAPTPGASLLPTTPPFTSILLVTSHLSASFLLVPTSPSPVWKSAASI